VKAAASLAVTRAGLARVLRAGDLLAEIAAVRQAKAEVGGYRGSRPS
jgi:hypothetical protein